MLKIIIGILIIHVCIFILTTITIQFYYLPILLSKYNLKSIIYTYIIYFNLIGTCIYYLQNLIYNK